MTSDPRVPLDAERCPNDAADMTPGPAEGQWVCLQCRESFTEPELEVLHQTLRFRLAEVERTIEENSRGLHRWWLRRKLRRTREAIDTNRDQVLRDEGIIP